MRNSTDRSGIRRSLPVEVGGFRAQDKRNHQQTHENQKFEHPAISRDQHMCFNDLHYGKVPRCLKLHQCY